MQELVFMFEDVIPLLEQISKDRTVPRNIRLKCEESVKILQNSKEELALRINAVISMLDDMSNDPNIPMYTRTQIWNIVSILESKQK